MADYKLCTNLQGRFFMSAKQKLKRALNSIYDAEKALKRALRSGDSDLDFHKVLRELSDAESYIKKAIREVD